MYKQACLKSYHEEVDRVNKGNADTSFGVRELGWKFGVEYWPQFETQLCHWDETRGTLGAPLQKVAGVPFLLQTEFRQPGRSREDSSVAVASYNRSAHLLSYLAARGVKLSLSQLQTSVDQ